MIGCDPNAKQILRRLAARIREIAELPIQNERIRLWKKHNALRPERPMLLVFPEGSWEELIPSSALECADREARAIEMQLRRRIFQHERLGDDLPIERTWNVPTVIENSGWGLKPQWDMSPQTKGANRYHPVILEPSDLKKLRFPELRVNEQTTSTKRTLCEDIFGDLLEIRQVGVGHVGFNFMALYCQLRGLEQVMLDMYSEPQMLHDAIAFIEEGFRRLLKQYWDLGLLTLNNDGTYHSSGGVGYTDELPKPGFDPNHVRPIDIWASSQSQELTAVSPEQHEEFCLAYERRILAPFGLNGYGCCEDLTRKFDIVFTIPNLRRISISPFTDIETAAEQIQNRAIYSWKPQPMDLVGAFSSDRIRCYLRRALDATRGCVIEMILKDTHTCEYHPERFTRWVQIAREEIDRRMNSGN